MSTSQYLSKSAKNKICENDHSYPLSLPSATRTWLSEGECMSVMTSSEGRLYALIISPPNWGWRSSPRTEQKPQNKPTNGLTGLQNGKEQTHQTQTTEWKRNKYTKHRLQSGKGITSGQRQQTHDPVIWVRWVGKTDTDPIDAYGCKLLAL